MMQKGFLAKRSRPGPPRYRQQQPALQILTVYSTPNTTIITNSCSDTPSPLHHPHHYTTLIT